MIGELGPASSRCSRAACTAEGVWNINWRNPRIHGEDRVKVWIACDEHLEFLRDYLAGREFPVVVTPLGQSVNRVVPE